MDAPQSADGDVVLLLLLLSLSKQLHRRLMGVALIVKSLEDQALLFTATTPPRLLGLLTIR